MHETQFLAHAVLLFGAALLTAWVFRALRAPATIGFLFAGILIGPSGFRLISGASVGNFAELGLVMLLFTIGLELSPEPLLRAGRRLTLAALLQVVLVGLVTAGVLMGLFTMPWRAVIVLSAATALSSTAIVLSQLSAHGQTGTTGGTLMTGVLLLQDIFVILLMIFLPLFAGGEGVDVSTVMLRGFASVAGLVMVTLIARRVVPLFLGLVMAWGGRELITLFAVVAALTGAYGAGLAGWSWGLGACIAGLILSQTDLRHQLHAEILPFRDVFNALFFMSMSMLVDLHEVAPQLPLIAAAVLVVLVVKALLTGLAVRGAGWPLRLAIFCGIGLCTVSEFSYVLAREAERLHILSGATLNVFTAIIVGTMMLGSVLFPAAQRASAALSARLGAAQDQEVPPDARTGGHVIIVGYGINGQNLARVLKATGIPFVVVELNPSLAQSARSAGHEVVVGDAARGVILGHAGLGVARALVIAINDQEATRRIVAQARRGRLELYILARTRYTSELETLHRLGANQVIPEEFETSIEIFAHVLKHFGIPDNIIAAQVMVVRSANYGMLRGRPAAGAQRADLVSLLEATTTQTYMLETGSTACGNTLRDLHLRARTGVTIIAVVREGKATTNPPPDFPFEAGDVLVLLGAHKQLDEAKAVLSPPRVAEA